MEGLHKESAVPPGDTDLGPETLERGVPAAEAEEAVEILFEKGVRPIVTIRKEHWPQVQKHGLEPHPSWIPRFDNVVGTLGTQPYEPEEDRVLLRVNIEDPHVLQPRMTGKDKAFHGIVVFRNSVRLPADMLEVIQKPPEPPTLH